MKANDIYYPLYISLYLINKCFEADRHSLARKKQIYATVFIKYINKIYKITNKNKLHKYNLLTSNETYK